MKEVLLVIFFNYCVPSCQAAAVLDGVVSTSCCWTRKLLDCYQLLLLAWKLLQAAAGAVRKLLEPFRCWEDVLKLELRATGQLLTWEFAAAACNLLLQ
jgi:hypothetical protein